MDLRGDLKTIKRTLSPTFGSSISEGSSFGDIEIKADYGCQKVIDTNTCSVCLEKRCNTMLLPCSHQFHAECIIQWTERQFSCPMCRTEISHFVPLRNMKSKQEADFVKLWNKHYMSPRSTSKDFSKKVDFKASFSHPVIEKDATLKSSPVKTLKRTPSLSMMKTSAQEREEWECTNCNGSLKNEFVYFAFDQKFCSTPCRLKYARSNMPKKHVFDEGTTSFYVDFSQVMKYMNRKQSSNVIDVRSLRECSDNENLW